jgi:hypothetical protein
MIGTIGWLALLASSLLLEILSRAGVLRTPALARSLALVGSSLGGRVLLALFWVFAGLHLFTRYTLAGH